MKLNKIEPFTYSKQWWVPDYSPTYIKVARAVGKIIQDIAKFIANLFIYAWNCCLVCKEISKIEEPKAIPRVETAADWSSQSTLLGGIFLLSPSSTDSPFLFGAEEIIYFNPED
ncbi:MAG: hypothetical protein JSS32_04830 [Verrucomicrobia bacterium]|nr:hypothetical protein [Verrucomicrobiota bacterium]